MNAPTAAILLATILSAGCSGPGVYGREFVIYDGRTGRAEPNPTEPSAAGDVATEASAVPDDIVGPVEASSREADPAVQRIFVLQMLSAEFARAIADGLDTDGAIAARKAAVDRELGMRLQEIGPDVFKAARRARLERLLDLQLVDPARATGGA